MSIRKIRDSVSDSRPAAFIREWIRTHSLPGFEGIPIYNVGSFVIRELQKENLIVRANAMSFSFFLSIFPSILVLFAILPLLPIRDLVDTAKETIQELLPSQASGYVIEIIDSLTQESQFQVLSVGIVLTLWFASNGMISMIHGFEKNYAISYHSRSWLKVRWVALKLVVVLGLTFLTSMIFIVFGRALLNGMATWIDIDPNSYEIIMILRWFAIIILFYGGISLVYRYGPSMKSKIKFISAGATFAVLMSILSSLLFSYYINRFNNYNELYGSIGALIVLMIWIQLNSIFILIGYELNAGIRIHKDLAELGEESSRLEQIN